MLPCLVMISVASGPFEAMADGPRGVSMSTATSWLRLRQDPGEPSDPPASCVAGRLTIRDLPAIQEAFVQGVAREREEAEAWQPDARLVGLRVGCRLLEAGFNWRGIFFSDGIQTYFFSDTRETRTVDDIAPPGPTLGLTGVSFERLRLSLLRAGYDDDVQINPSSNIELRLNSDEAPFGPPEAPRGERFFHVAIEERGEVIDLFINAADGTVYQFRPQT
jgi:hypothetical protein